MKLKTIVYSLLFLLLSGCLELTEEIHVNKDLSGSLIYKLVPSKEVSGWAGLLGISNEFTLPADWELEKYVNRLKGQPGITQADYSVTNGGKGFMISIGFSDYKSLSKAFLRSFDAKSPIGINYIKIKKHSISRRNFSPAIERYLKNDKSLDVSPEMLDWVEYKTYVVLPSEVKKVTCKSCKESADRKTVSSKLNAGNIARGQSSTAFKIKY